MSGFVRWDGEYDKRTYEARTDDGEVVVCWPNAGVMLAMDGTGRRFQPNEVDVRFAPWQEPGYAGDVPRDAAASVFTRRRR